MWFVLWRQTQTAKQLAKYNWQHKIDALGQLI
jgi:hypothetical protein